MDEGTIKRTEDRHLAGVYQKMPPVVVRGQGVHLWDINGKRYIDCMGGYGVALVGHCHPRVVEAVKLQTERLMTCHGSLYNDVRAELAEMITSMTPKGLDMALLCNSGAEAVEAALKLARKRTGRKGFVAFTGSYHGKTLGALSVTWGQKYREPFGPLLQDIAFAKYGDIDDLQLKVTRDTAAVILEPIQGEAGIHLPPPDFLRQVRELCDSRGVMLIVDEIQTGLGRTGRLWASEHWNLKPDILCLAKGLGGGIPMGAILAAQDDMAVLKVGEHTSTFGGGPLACAASLATLNVIRSEKLWEQAERTGRFMLEGLRKLNGAHSCTREARGLGLMLALEMRFDIRDILFSAFERGVAILYSGKNVLRFLPPLIIKKEEVDEVLAILDELLAVEDSKRRG